MGEAKRKRLAGYVPEERSKPIQPHAKKFSVGYGGRGTLGMVAALLANYPKLPNDQ